MKRITTNCNRIIITVPALSLCSIYFYGISCSKYNCRRQGLASSVKVITFLGPAAIEHWARSDRKRGFSCSIDSIFIVLPLRAQCTALPWDSPNETHLSFHFLSIVPLYLALSLTYSITHWLYSNISIIKFTFIQSNDWFFWKATEGDFPCHSVALCALSWLVDLHHRVRTMHFECSLCN